MLYIQNNHQVAGTKHVKEPWNFTWEFLQNNKLKQAIRRRHAYHHQRHHLHLHLHHKEFH